MLSLLVLPFYVSIVISITMNLGLHSDTIQLNLFDFIYSEIYISHVASIVNGLRKTHILIGETNVKPNSMR